MDDLTSRANDEIVLLAGRPSAREFCQYVKSKSIDPFAKDDYALLEDWQAANRQLARLEATEAGLCDSIASAPIPLAMRSAADEALSRPELADTYRVLQHNWELVEIEKLVVTQRSVNIAFVNKLTAALPPHPSDLDVMSIAAGQMPLAPDFHLTSLSERLYGFTSSSTNLRFLDTYVLKPTEVPGLAVHGNAAAVIAVCVGFSPNLVSAVRIGSRLILLNGTHRLVSLYQLGFRKAPCLVRYASNVGDLGLIGASDIEERADLYLKGARPPLFKDYFDERVHKRFAAQRLSVVLHLQLTMQQWRMPRML